VGHTLPRTMLLAALCTDCGAATGLPVGTSADGSADGSDAGTGLLASADAQACMVVAASYDRSCQVDSDCALVPPGGNVCAPCANGVGCLFCNLASINQAAAPSYLAALHAGLDFSYGQSVQHCDSSCPAIAIGMTGVCDAGRCTSRTEGVCQ